eukprot:scaffold125602_cov33-Cyclotella_meneghiniana.AAC.2
MKTGGGLYDLLAKVCHLAAHFAGSRFKMGDPADFGQPRAHVIAFNTFRDACLMLFVGKSL